MVRYFLISELGFDNPGFLFLNTKTNVLTVAYRNYKREYSGKAVLVKNGGEWDIYVKGLLYYVNIREIEESELALMI